MILGLKAVMTLATLCYAVGYASRHRDNRLHRRFMLAGTGLVLAGLALLAVGTWGFGASCRVAYGVVRAMGMAEGSQWLLVLYGIVAGVSLILLVVQAGTGIRRVPLHSRLHPFTIGLWLFTYASGMFLLA